VSPHGAAGRGVFLTIEGPEGAGKTTQSERLRDALAADGTEVVLTREPGGTALGERIRDVLLTVAAGTPHDPRADALLFNAARAQLVAEVIRPALERGAVVISTRFADSTLAYQGYGAGLPIGELRAIEAIATGGLRPDRTILLDVPVETGLGRKGGEELTRFETAFDVAFHRRVRDGFLALAALEPARFVVIEASRDAAAVAADVLGAALGTLRSDEPRAHTARIPG
jgi:dTMP kinase